MQTMKETAANVAAAAKSGMEKTRATVQEKMERMTADSPQEKEMATATKEDIFHNADLKKQDAFEQNAAAKESGGSYSYSTTGDVGQPTGGHQMSALPGHGSGEPAGQVVEGTIKSHPIGKATGTGRPTTAHNTHVGAGANQGYGTGGAYSG
ncbi:late embryogenesis abundant protein 46-like [Sesamum indicum]|uniref:Late embryogenesis abundant protein 46-like n=1 Tax=Sesamum indicum TaxID=4182 RepID=A0A6I9T961_SESIN|nr:late embryogenesis abundant protein 46-like [Sesamum indicum]